MSAQLIGRGEVVALPSDQVPPSLRRDMLDFSQQHEVDSSGIRRELGYSEIVPFGEALRRTIAWERSNLPEKIPPEDFDYAAEAEALAAGQKPARLQGLVGHRKAPLRSGFCLVRQLTK